MQAKQTYRIALNNLEQISEEVNQNQKFQLIFI